MIRGLVSRFGRGGSARAEGASVLDTEAPPISADLTENLDRLNEDPFLVVSGVDLRFISVFDDLKYDRSDLDMLSGPMRKHAIKRLAPVGFRQTSGNVIAHASEDIRVLIPKIHALGASPFDATRYLDRRSQDYVLLTPTQAACQMIDRYPCEDAVERIKTLIAKHPVNILRIMDFLEPKEIHEAFEGAIGHLKYVQRKAVESDNLRSRRALG